MTAPTFSARGSDGTLRGLALRDNLDGTFSTASMAGLASSARAAGSFTAIGVGGTFTPGAGAPFNVSISVAYATGAAIQLERSFPDSDVAFTGSVAAGVLTASAPTSGALGIGKEITSGSTIIGTINGQASGATGGAGTYTLAQPIGAPSTVSPILLGAKRWYTRIDDKMRQKLPESFELTEAEPNVVYRLKCTALSGGIVAHRLSGHSA